MQKKKILPRALIAVLVPVFAVSLLMVIREISESRRALEGFAVLAESVEKASDSSKTKRDIHALKLQNPDCIGWLYIDGTSVNYPVMHTPDEPEKYLRRGFSGSRSNHGVPFLDGICTTSSGNLIIYGHNMKDGTMFSDLAMYLDDEFLGAHPTIELETVSGKQIYTVKSARIVHETDTWYSNIEPPGDIKYLTLSTCYGENDEMRLIVVAEKRR